MATPYRHGSKELAEAFFLDGMTQAMKNGFGCVDTGIDDLGSNPEHLKNLGKDSMGNR